MGSEKLIKRNYHAPFSTYQVIQKATLIEMLEITYPKIMMNFEKFDVCYPKPTIFLEIHQ